MTQKPTTQLWNSKKKKKIMPLAQIAPPSLVRARLGVNLWVQDPLNLYVIMSKKKMYIYITRLDPFLENFNNHAAYWLKKKKKNQLFSIEN